MARQENAKDILHKNRLALKKQDGYNVQFQQIPEERNGTLAVDRYARI